MLIKKILFTLVVMCSSLSVEAKTPNIILIGLPGTGKGSISQHLVSEHGYYQICLGDLFREEINVFVLSYLGILYACYRI